MKHNSVVGESNIVRLSPPFPHSLKGTAYFILAAQLVLRFKHNSKWRDLLKLQSDTRSVVKVCPWIISENNRVLDILFSEYFQTALILLIIR